MKILYKSHHFTTIFIGIFILSGCSTTPNLDKVFGQSYKDGLKAQQLPVRSAESVEVYVGSRELKSGVDAYMKDSPKDAGNFGVGASSGTAAQPNNK